MKLTDEQKEMLALLPNVKGIKTLRDSSKLLLSYIIEMYGMDFAKNNGYVFKTNKEVISQTGIKQERTLIDAARELEIKGYITRTAGQRVKGEKNKASEYRLQGEMLQYALPNTALNTVSNTALNTVSNTVSNTALNTVSNTVSNTVTNTALNTVSNTVSQYDAIILKINKLEERIKALELQNTVTNTVTNTVSQNTVKKNVKYSTDTESDTESETNDNNDNTEGYNIKDHNQKENITEDNLEVLKKNENEISKDEILNNEIPSDLPPLNIDDFFDNSNLSESRSNENENSNEELEYSIFGDDIPKDENLKGGKTVKFKDGKFQVVDTSETEDEINSSSDVEQDKNNSNLNKMKKTNNSKVEFSNNDNLNESNISNDEKVKDYSIFGKLQSIKDLQSGILEGYLFTEWYNLTSASDISNGYHQVKQYISLDKNQIKASVSECGTWGILSFKDNVYSFIPCNNNNTLQQRNIVTSSCAAAETQNKANTDVKITQVDIYTTTEDKTLKKPLKMRQNAFEDKTATPTNEEKSENTPNNTPQATEITETDNNTTSDVKDTENAQNNVKTSTVDNYTTTTKTTAGNSVKMANKQSNVNNSNTTVKTNTNPNPNDPKVWEYLKLRLTMKQGSYLMRDVLNEYKEMQAKNIHSVIAYMEDMCKAVRSALAKGIINQMQYDDFKRVFQTLSKGKYNYWRKVFSTRAPQTSMISEKKMWEILGKPKVVNEENAENKAETSTVGNYTNGNNITAGTPLKMPQNVSNNTVVYPDLNQLYKMGYDEAIATLHKFVAEHPSLTQCQKVYFNENIASAFGIQLYNAD